MKKALKAVLILSIAAFISACKLAVIVVEGGEVQSIGSGTCIASEICVVEVTDPNFSETFTAVPDDGWYFQKWNTGSGFFCGRSTDPNCALSFKGHEESEEVGEMVTSSELFYLMPIFKPYSDIITVDGKQWYQPYLFTGLSWEDVNAICPDGICNGMLNGYDLTGWSWASVDDVKTLFNEYIGDNVLDSETDFYQDVTGEAVERFFEDGWRPTFDGYLREWEVTEWRVMLRDQQSNSFGRRTEGIALAALSYEREGQFNAASFNARFTSTEGAENSYGATFYR